MIEDLTLDGEKDVVLLDCTLRDGGYYNNWDFDPKLVLKYLQGIGDSGIDVIELGLRSFGGGEFLGPFAFSTDDVLKSLPLPPKAKIAVLVNAGELARHEGGIDEAIDLLFAEAADSPVDLVRVAAHPRELKSCSPIVNRLKAMGYEVSLNVMQIGGLSNEAYEECLKQVSELKRLDVFYIADSLGNMSQKRVIDLISRAKKELDIPIGMHAHDNKGQALANSFAALEAGASWIDGTILGMGRGAGNVKMEQLLIEVDQKCPGKYKPDAIFPIVLKDFRALQEKYVWGYSLPYYLSAMHGIHPTYVQKMVGRAKMEPEDILGALDYLRDVGASSFSKDDFDRALSGNQIACRGDWDADGWCKGKEVLIVGSGPSLSRYKNQIINFIERKNPIVLSVNLTDQLPREIISAYVACSKLKLAQKLGLFLSASRPLIYPMGILNDSQKQKLSGVEVWDYGIYVNGNGFDVESDHCSIPGAWPSAYALAISTIGGAKRILLAGFDGFAESDPRQSDMVETLKGYNRQANAVPLISITPTTYPVMVESVYSPLI